jgi:type II secretion system protein J
MNLGSFTKDVRGFGQKGLTLVEMVVVTLLLALMGSILYSSLNGISTAKEAIQSQRQSARTARFVLGRMSRELRGALAEPLYLQQEEVNGSGMRRQNPFLVGENAKKDGEGSDALQFVSSSGAQAVYGAMSNYGHVQIRYGLVENPDEERVNQDLRRFLLIREETPAGVEDDDIIEKRRIVFPLANNISSLNFRYFSDGEWKDKWDDADSGLPEAVEISLLVLGPSGIPDSYKTAVAIAPRRGRQNSRSQSGFPGFATAR